MIYEAKYTTCSSFFTGKSSNKPILLGTDFKYQVWATGAYKSMCHILSLLTEDFVTSTPHLSQTIHLYLILLYFPQAHS